MAKPAKIVEAPKRDSFSALKNHNYERVKIVGADGKARYSAGNEDALAKAMLIYTAGGGDLDRLVKQNDLGDDYVAANWDNQGLLRMTIGNKLRAKVKRGEEVSVGTTKISSLTQKLDLPDSVASQGKKKKAAKKAA